MLARCTNSASKTPCASSSGTKTAASTATTVAACDTVAYLPLAGRVGSLNVATATALALYEARRQEWTRTNE